MLSAYTEASYAKSSMESQPTARGYLLKDSLMHPQVLEDALSRVHSGECVVDAAVVRTLFETPAGRRGLEQLSPREVEVLACMAEGLTDRAIAERLYVTPKTVATHVGHIFTRLDLPDSASDNRRVHAVLTYLSARS